MKQCVKVLRVARPSMRRWFGSYDPEDLNLREMDRLLIEKRRSEDTQKSQKLLNLLSLEVLRMSTTRIHNDSANISGKVQERTAKRCKGILVGNTITAHSL